MTVVSVVITILLNRHNRPRRLYHHHHGHRRHDTIVIIIIILVVVDKVWSLESMGNSLRGPQESRSAQDPSLDLLKFRFFGLSVEGGAAPHHEPEP